MAPQTGTEIATIEGFALATTIAKSRPKKVKHSVRWLERELAEARNDLQDAGHRLDAINILLRQKNDELVQALNQRDGAYAERDMLRIQIQREARWFQEDRENWAKTRLDYERENIELHGQLATLQEVNAWLGETNQGNFDKAHRNSDVAAVLVSHLVAVTGLAPAKIMLELFNVAVQMGVDLQEASEEVRNALKRGNDAQIDEVVITAPPNERDMFEEKVDDDEMLYDDEFQDKIERYGMPSDFLGYNRY